MTLEEAKEYAKTMSYTEAVYNALQGRAVPYKKATKIKFDELLEKAKELDELEEWRSGKRVRMANTNTETLIFEV